MGCSLAGRRWGEVLVGGSSQQTLTDGTGRIVSHCLLEVRSRATLTHALLLPLPQAGSCLLAAPTQATCADILLAGSSAGEPKQNETPWRLADRGRDAPECPTTHKTAPPAQDYPAPKPIELRWRNLISHKGSWSLWHDSLAGGRPWRLSRGAHSKAAGNRDQSPFGNGPTFQDVNGSAGRQFGEVASEQLRVRCLLAQARAASSRSEKVWEGNCVFLSGMENKNRLLEKPQP